MTKSFSRLLMVQDALDAALCLELIDMTAYAIAWEESLDQFGITVDDYVRFVDDRWSERAAWLN